MIFSCTNCKTSFEARSCSTGLCQSCYQKIKKAEWHQKNKEKRRQQNIQWKKDNPERFKELSSRASKKFYSEHRQECVKRVIASAKKRRERDPLAKLQRLVRKNINTQMRKRSLTKSQRTIEYIGCSWNEFRAYLESLMTTEMNWTNYGSLWSLDHICPCSQAVDELEFLKLQHYSNFRPLRKRENLLKSNNKTPDAEIMCHTLLGREWRVVS